MEKIKELLTKFKKEDFGKDVDLHIHSTCSDGKMSPEQIITFAHQKNMRYFSITDHNTLNAYLNSDVSNNPKIIPAIEFDCWYRGILIHILGYGIDIKNEALCKICAKNKAETEKDIIRFFKFRHPKTAIAAIKEAGGIAVLAHPACCWAISLEHYVKSLINLGIEGLEVYYPYKRHRGIIKFHLQSAVNRIADKYNLIKTGGSDAHGETL